MFNIIIFGPPGSGKGTQSKKLASELKLKHISTGDILRSEVKQQTELGKKAQAIMERGELVPDDLLIDILHSVIKGNPDAAGFIFDGFPRTIVQAEALDELMDHVEENIDVVISLVVPDDEVISRLLKRAELEGRKDDNKEAITTRLSVYKKQTSPLLAYYRKQNKLEDVEGVGSIDGIFKDVVTVINKYMS